MNCGHCGVVRHALASEVHCGLGDATKAPRRSRSGSLASDTDEWLAPRKRTIRAEDGPLMRAGWNPANARFKLAPWGAEVTAPHQ